MTLPGDLRVGAASMLTFTLHPKGAVHARGSWLFWSHGTVAVGGTVLGRLEAPATTQKTKAHPSVFL